MRYKMIISYDGSYFHGFQRQNNAFTIQEKIEDALNVVFKSHIDIKYAGRTDAFVHAIGQVVHFDSDINIPLDNLRRTLNKMIAPHIYIKTIDICSDDFHSRYTPHVTEYHYIINTGEFSPFKSNYVLFYQYKFDIKKIKEAMSCFLGTHDFKALSKASEKENTIRTIYSFDVIEKENEYEFIIRGNGFLHNMVRIIMALLLKVNEGVLTKENINEIILSKDRKKAPWCAKGNGLYLYKIEYQL